MPCGKPLEAFEVELSVVAVHRPVPTQEMRHAAQDGALNLSFDRPNEFPEQQQNDQHHSDSLDHACAPIGEQHELSPEQNARDGSAPFLPRGFHSGGNQLGFTQNRPV